MKTRFERVIESDIMNIPGVLDQLEKVMQEDAFSVEEILDARLALEEAMTNVIVHGYGKRGEQIVISCHSSPDRIEIRLADTAPRFDPLSVPAPDLEKTLDDREIGGLGIYLIRTLMDDVSYWYEDGWNILILSKRRQR
jgi:anti-sigma regulatory factor (Ser/Thr protein kinase)